MKKLMPKLKGFTIIEVIIVLVIGAVIMLAVFLVVPQLQVNARNNQRRSDIQRVLVAARQYYTTNTFGGANDAANIKNIISSTFQDPSLTQKMAPCAAAASAGGPQTEACPPCRSKNALAFFGVSRFGKRLWIFSIPE